MALTVIDGKGSRIVIPDAVLDTLAGLKQNYRVADALVELVSGDNAHKVTVAFVLPDESEDKE
jgi:hypothetical protein